MRRIPILLVVLFMLPFSLELSKAKDEPAANARRLHSTVFVGGAVQAPGAYAMPEMGSLTVIKAIALAGGILKDNRAKELLIVSPRAGGQFDRHTLSLRNLTNDDIVHSGDLVYVPRIRERPSLNGTRLADL